MAKDTNDTKTLDHTGDTYAITYQYIKAGKFMRGQLANIAPNKEIAEQNAKLALDKAYGQNGYRILTTKIW